jgi:Ribosomal L27e protein family
MPTRYNINAELGVDQIVTKLETLGDKENKEQQKDVLSKPDTREAMRKHIKGHFEEKYSGLDLNDTTQLKNTRLKFFFKKLRF